MGRCGVCGGVGNGEWFTERLSRWWDCVILPLSHLSSRIDDISC